jgi:hypothetical protein
MTAQDRSRPSMALVPDLYATFADTLPLILDTQQAPI